jgi:competence protein ComEC
MSTIQKKKYTITTPQQGDWLIDQPGISFQVISRNAKWDDLNNYSIVTRLTYGEVAFVFTGDALRDAEQAILTDGMKARANILKVGHHGFSDASTKDFLAAVGADIGIISVGLDGDKMSKPGQKTLERLESFGVKVYRTDELGNIEVTSDGVTYRAG